MLRKRGLSPPCQKRFTMPKLSLNATNARTRLTASSIGLKGRVPLCMRSSFSDQGQSHLRNVSTDKSLRAFRAYKVSQKMTHQRRILRVQCMLSPIRNFKDMTSSGEPCGLGYVILYGLLLHKEYRLISLSSSRYAQVVTTRIQLASCFPPLSS